MTNRLRDWRRERTDINTDGGNVTRSHLLALILNNHTVLNKAFNLPRPQLPHLSNGLSVPRLSSGPWSHTFQGKSPPYQGDATTYLYKHRSAMGDRPHGAMKYRDKSTPWSPE